MTGVSAIAPNDYNAAQLEQLKFALRAAEVGTWDLNIRERLVWWDERCKELYGFCREDVVPYDQVLQYIHPDDRQRTDEAVQGALDPQSEGRYDIQFRTVGAEDGRVRWLRCQGQAYFDKAGAVYRFSGIAQDITSQRHREQAMKNVELRFQRAFDNASLGMVILSREGDLQLVNQAYCQMMGYPQDELYQLNYKQLTYPDDLPTTVGQMEQLRQGAAPFVNVDKRSVRKDGSVFWMRFTVTRLVDQEGHTDSMIGICQDISTEIKNQQALEASRIRFQNLIINLPTPTGIYVGRDMTIQVANQAMLQLWGKDASVLGKKLYDGIPELIGQPFLELLQRVYDTGEQYHNPVGRADLVVDGRLQTFWFNYSYHPLYDENGVIYGVVNTATDITRQVIAIQQYQRAEQLLQQAVDLAQLSIWQIDRTNQTVTLSDKMNEWLGLASHVASASLIDVIAPPDLPQVSRAIQQACEPGSDGRMDIEHHVIHRQTGQQRVLRSVGQAQFDEQGQAVTISGFSQDITQQREMQLALEQLVQQRTEELAAVNERLGATNEEIGASNKEYAALNDELSKANALLIRSNESLQQFAYIASHDLQEPLRKIQSFGDVLLRKTPSTMDEESRFIFQRMVDAGARMSTLVSDLLTFSRISTRQEVLTPVSLQKVLETVLETLDMAIEQSQAQVHYQPLPTVTGDKGQLGQLFQNLISNAIKFTPAGQPPEIYITAAAIDRHALPPQVRPTSNAQRFHQISVRDNGIGFDEKYLDRIFQVFQRLHNKSQYPGTGIGLAICQRVAETHGGAITATSQPGKGATFSIYLPA